MINPKEIIEFYRLKQRGFSKLYIIFVLITINLFSISVLLDAARFFLAVPMLRVGIAVLIFTLMIGVVDKLRLEKGRSNLFLVLVESLRVTAYSILPILLIFVTVLFYLGKPSLPYFQDLRGAVSMLTVFLIISVLAKIFIFQIQVLTSLFEGRKFVRYLMYLSVFAIGLTSVLSYVMSDMLLPQYLSEWFMYETFIFFLELVFLYLSAEVALNYRTGIYILMFLSYFIVIFFSLTGGAEVLRLSYEGYGSAFPKIVTGVCLVSINAQLMDSRLKQFSVSQSEIRERSEVAMEDISGMLEEIRKDINISKKAIEKQDEAIKVLTKIIEKMTVSSSGVIEELRKELRGISIPQTFSSINSSFSKRIAEEIIRLQSSYRSSLTGLAGFMLGPRPIKEGGRKAINVESVSPIPLFILTALSFLELNSPVNGGVVCQKDLAEFLVSYHPRFQRKWSRRTAQNFINSFILPYIKSNEEAQLIFSFGKRGSIEVPANSAGKLIYDTVKEYLIEMGPENISLVLMNLSKIRDMTLKELKISVNELKKLF